MAKAVAKFRRLPVQLDELQAEENKKKVAVGGYRIDAATRKAQQEEEDQVEKLAQEKGGGHQQRQNHSEPDVQYSGWSPVC